MASSSRTRRPAKRRPAPARAKSRRAPARSARGRGAPRRPPRQPLLEREQARDLAGLLLGALAVFGVVVLWFGYDAGSLGAAFSRALRDAVGRFAVLVPPILVLGAVTCFARGRLRRLRAVWFGVAFLSVSLLVGLANDDTRGRGVRDHAGTLGGVLHGGIARALGEPGVAIVVLLTGIAGLLLVTGASLGAVAARLHVEVAETVRAVRDVVPERRDAAPAPAKRARAAAAAPKPAPRSVADEETGETPFDGATVFPELFVREEESRPELEPPAASAPAREPEPAAADALTDELTVGFDDAPAATSPYRLPDAAVLHRSTAVARSVAGDERVAAALLEALAHFGVEARLVGTVAGPRVTRYELQLAPGTKVGKVAALKDDLAYALATTEIRILAPIPGKQAVGVEVPNLSPNIVTLGDVSGAFPAGASPLSVWLGKDISGNAVHCDLAKMPHILIAGTTGSGKSGCVNAMLVSILLNATPEEVRLILIDPKKVELNHYEAIPHLLTPVVTNVKQAAAALLNIVGEMERRYEQLGAARSRNITEFNRARREAGRETLPYVLVVIDELADLMMVSPAEVEDAIIRLAQKSRAVGIHLVLATQRPSVDVITGMIKANVPSRAAFAVSSQTDSRVILDQGGAESLLGQGDMLFRPLGTSRLQRVQGAFVTEEEIALVVEQCRDQGEPEFAEDLLDLPEIVDRGDEGGRAEDELDPDEDPLLDDAIRCVVNHETASVSLIQRRLRVGYTRAGRLIDMLERRGVISGYEGSKPRQVLITEADLPRLLAKGE
jgi:S-DNA-T family DNA segregation ATPase FtsK/SpoIIIE